MTRIISFLERLYNSIRFNGFYLLLAFLFPVILNRLDAGTEIVNSMAEEKFSLNIGLSILSFSALSLSIWCIPTLAIRLFQFIIEWKLPGTDKTQNNALRNCLFDHLIKTYNGEGRPQLPVRYFAIAPWGLFIVTCLNVYQGTALMVTGIVAIITIIILGDWLKKKIVSVFEWLLIKKGPGVREEVFLWRYAGLLAIYFIVILSIILILKNQENVHLLKWLVCILNFLFLIAFYCYLVYMENSDLAKKSTANLSYKVSNLNYSVLLVYLLAAVITFYYLNQYQEIGCVSPVNVIVTMCTGLIIFFELVFTAQLLLVRIVSQGHCDSPALMLKDCPTSLHELRATRLKIYRLGLLALILVVINLYFFSSSNSHRVRAPEAKTGEYIPDSARPLLTDYFQQWMKGRNLKESDSFDVYLISGQGGGSRAAAWFFMNMHDLQNRHPGFFDKVFSISTVSGSTTGANMYLASKFYKIPITNSIKEKTDSLYAKNYMSSAFYGLLLGDFIESFTDMGKPFPRDRNYHLQKEEEAAFRETFGVENSEAFFEQDFMAPYLKSPLNSPKLWPLFFINTTIVNFGTRAVFSPVQMDSVSVARDLYGEFKNNRCNGKANLPQVVCVNQSQAFPVLSAYNWLECIGRLGDGGISENSGCATTLEVYQKLRQYCDRKRLKVRFICLNITNGNLDADFKVSYQNASIFNTISAVANSPFAGNETYAYHNLERQLHYFKSNYNFTANDRIRNRDTVVNCSLDTSITLTRTMSKKAIETMFEKMVKKKFELPK